MQEAFHLVDAGGHGWVNVPWVGLRNGHVCAGRTIDDVAGPRTIDTIYCPKRGLTMVLKIDPNV